jgi:hypothetical protein
MMLYAQEHGPEEEWRDVIDMVNHAPKEISQAPPPFDPYRNVS